MPGGAEKKKVSRSVNIRGLLTAVSVLVSFSCVHPQSNSPFTERTDSNTTETGRKEFRRHLYNDVIRKNLSYPLSDKTESMWKGAYWGCELSYYRDTLVFNSLKTALSQFNSRSAEFSRAALEAVYTLYPEGFEESMSKVLDAASVSKHFAMAAEYLLRAKHFNEDERVTLHNLMVRKFPGWKKDPILLMLDYRLKAKEEAIPDIPAMLKNEYWNGRTVIFSFQRKNRDYEGLTVIRKEDGKFLRDSTGEIFRIKHLARALSDLPGYLTNGNTPSGIYAVMAIDTSGNRFIGGTPFIVTVLPFEVSPGEFFHRKELKDAAWSMDMYRKMLPKEWLEYFPVYEAFYAGMAGRSEVVMHGTTIDPEFYKGTAFYPNTPSLGCMTAGEIYSPQDGRLLSSDQQRLIEAFMSCYKNEAYLAVLNIDGKNEEVQIKDILPYITEAEK